MKKSIILLNYLLLTISLFADEPPGWFEFCKTSDNGLFKAEVYSLDEEPNYNSDWFYKVIDEQGKIVHQGSYNHDGYYSTLLTNNGKYFLYINNWFDKNGLIYIYSKDGLKVFTNKEIKINSIQLIPTVSHKVWLERYYIESDNTLVLDLYIGFKKKINLETSEVTW